MDELNLIASIAAKNVIPIFANGVVMTGSAREDRILFYERQLRPLPTKAINEHANP